MKDIKKIMIEKKGILIWSAAALLLLLTCVLLWVFVSSGGYPVRINEVMASNTDHPNEDGLLCDYIELYNKADHPIDLSGFQLGDIAGNTRYRFPDNAVIEAGGYYMVYCDKTIEDPDYAPFGISRAGGEAFYLIASNDAIVDSVTTIAMDSDETMVRLADDRWELSAATPGYANDDVNTGGRDIYNAEISPLRITEFSSSETGYSSELGLLCDWIELQNTAQETLDISGFALSDNMGNDKFRFPQGTAIAPGEYLLVSCSNEASTEHTAPFALSQLGEEKVILKDPGGRVIEILDTPAMENGQSYALAEDIWQLTEMPSPGYENSALGHESFLKQIGAEEGTVVISEVMAAQQSILPDGSGAFYDWVELYNTSDKTIDLAGWFLSDDAEEPQKWEIPALTLQPEQRAVVFCSGKQGSDQELHASFSLSSGGEHVVLASYLGNVVDAVSFEQAEDHASFIFDQADSGTLSQYPTPGYTNDEAGYEAFSKSRIPEGPLAIWEVMTSNETYLPQTLGQCYDWVELRNISDASINLANFSISDDPENPKLYILPDQTLDPGGYVTIILSGDVNLSTGMYDHAGFALNAKQDMLLVYDHQETLLDHVYLKDIPVGYSYGRCDGVGGFYYSQPTPNAPNAEGKLQISAMPVADTPSGVYTQESSYTVSLQAKGDIYYTLDGSDPDVNSNVYQGPISITETAVLRAAAVEEGKLTSDIYTATFLIGQSHELPVVSLVTDPDNLWGSKGIYKNGDMTIKEQKRTAHVSYLGEDGSFSLNCELSLHGATTVTAFDKKSFSVRFQDAYDGPLYYDVFEDGEVTAFRSLIIRTAHESTFSSQMRDVLMAHIAARNCDTLLSQKYKYVALYLNGEYWGLYAFRELHSEAHYASYMNVPSASVSMVRFCSDEQNSLNELYNRCANKTYLMNEENFAYAKTVLDMSSVIDWIIMEAYVGNFDIHGNMRYYYSPVDGLWRCGLVDVDLGMFSERAFDETATSFHHGQLVDALLQNEEFQDMMARRLAELLAGPMSDENMKKTIDEIAAMIRSETPLEGARWGCSPEMWEKLVIEMKDYCDGRAKAMIDSLSSWVGFSQEEKAAYFGDLL